MATYISTNILDIIKEKGVSDKLMTQDELMLLLRNKYNIFVTILVDKTMEPKFTYQIDRYKNSRWSKQLSSKWLFMSYEIAVETALNEALTMIDNKEIRKKKLKKINENK